MSTGQSTCNEINRYKLSRMVPMYPDLVFLHFDEKNSSVVITTVLCNFDLIEKSSAPLCTKCAILRLCHYQRETNILDTGFNAFICYAASFVIKCYTF